MELVKTELDNNEVYVYDFNSLNFDDVLNFVSNNPDSLEYINVDTNHKIENVSQKLYEDKNYFDLIMLLNNRDMISGMPKTTDAIAKEAEDETYSYFKNYEGNIPTWTEIDKETGKEVEKTLIDLYKDKLIEKKTEEDLENQKFIVLKPSYKKQFLRTTRYKI